MMLELPIIPTVSLLAVLHCVIGLTAAAIASQKRLNQNRWLVWGLIGGTVALVMALLSEDRTYAKTTSDQDARTTYRQK